MQKVGEKLFPDTKSTKLFTYKMVKHDCDGWADASLFLPASFDLVFLKLEGVKSIISGWYTGNRWDGRRLKEDQKVLYWKRNEDDEEENYVKIIL